ncbi:VWA domain-containing protein [uncultured Jannaschia sp.]|uniref:vWA domain-containing protein n=1 Tax=uncultured Jannaschia sp. TaxID=293347 RepID=UPI00260F9B81|nr:VWA domain-containing protein [uncultured Jannaschia sp.]
MPREWMFSLKLLLMICLAGQAIAQETEPRVDAVAPEGAAEVVLNEVNINAYPDVRLFVTVQSEGEPVTGLSAEDFRVREDEVDQSPLTVDPQLPPLSVVLATDASGSMADAMEETKAAATAFLATLAPQDRTLVLSFARELSELTDMTEDRETVTGAIEGLTARGDTALYDALARSVELVGAEDGRKAIVLLSDGVDDDGAGNPLSEATADTVLEEAASVNVPIFVVGLGGDLDTEGLTRIAGETGGRFLTAGEASELDTVYESIGTQLSGQYSVSYTSSLPADGTTRRVDIATEGQQASKSYAPETGQAAASASGVECAPPALFTSYIPDYAEVLELEREGLIDGNVRYAQVNAMGDDILASAAEAEMSSDCVSDIYTAVMEAREAETMESGITDQMIRRISAARAEACVASAQTPEDFLPCFEETGPLATNDYYWAEAQKALAEPFAVALSEQYERRAALAFMRDAASDGIPIAAQIQTLVMTEIMAQ